MKKLFIILAAVCLLWSCNNSINEHDGSQKRGSSGKTLELLVVADQDVYRGDTKELVDSLFGRPQDCLPQPESMFTVINIPMSSYRNTEMFRTHRNIVLLDVNPENSGKVYMHIDDYAAPQVVFDFARKDKESLSSFFADQK